MDVLLFKQQNIHPENPSNLFNPGSDIIHQKKIKSVKSF